MGDHGEHACKRQFEFELCCCFKAFSPEALSSLKPVVPDEENFPLKVPVLIQIPESKYFYKAGNYFSMKNFFFFMSEVGQRTNHRPTSADC